MEKSNIMAKKVLILCCCTVLLVFGLLVSIGFNIYFSLCYINGESYLQSTEEIYIMEAGILRNNLEFKDGENHEFTYNFTHEDYPILKSKYKIEDIAGNGTEFEKALQLMDEFAPRLTHKSNYDNHVEMTALSLLEYSLDNKNKGINCRNKAQILNEMCLAQNIYARKVWIMPNSGYDGDCHVVNEAWDSTLNKWVMLDITNNEYWVDENGTPLSVLEIRYKGAMHEFCTPVAPNDKLKNLEKTKQNNIGDFLYIMKNMAYTEYCASYTVGEIKPLYMLFPKNLETKYELLISQSTVEKSPINL